MNSLEDWVISGFSGRFPESENLDRFWDNLIQGKDMVSDNPRWDSNAYETPLRAGKIPLIEKFDASFFGVSGSQANKMDPKIRISLEVVYEAVVDAGVNIKSLSGGRVGVFMSTSCSEALDIWLRSTENCSGHYITGCHPSMLADRISYAFNFKGPSCVLDSGCSASFSALQYAMLAMKSGLCDSAIVGGAGINTLPFISTAFFNFKALSVDGKCKAFDASADGFVRSEAVVALYICRKDCAKRLYANISGVKCFHDGHKQDGISVPSLESQVQLLKEVYAETGVNPLEVVYVEAHGTGTKVGDPIEIAALADVFCNGRVGVLLAGSVKSNMGHAEQVSGLCGIIKILLARRFGVIPPNLHFKIPNPECEALVDGRIQIVVQATPFHGKYVGINSFGMGGTSAHVILKFEDMDSTRISTNYVKPNINKLKTIPTLILASGRTREGVKNFLNQAMKISMSSNSRCNEFLCLLHEIASDHVLKHKFTGYAVSELATEFEVAIRERLETPTSIYYVYTGLGSQYLGMTKAMRNFKTFNNSIQLSTQIMRRVGVDLEFVFQTEDTICINSLQNAFVAITTCQIALTDLLESLDIHPDVMMGQSLGEVTCAYTDGCLTQSQALLASFYRAKAFLESNLPPGTMAATALSWEEAQKRCPHDLFPAIHSAIGNVTISGPNQSIEKFVELLNNEGIFAKEVKSAIHAYHSPYVRSSEQLMLNLLKEAIPEKKRRSKKWLSSSIPKQEWDSLLSTFSSPEYFVNNAMSPVLLHDVLQHVTHKSLVLEIGAHCFLQTILKQSLPETVTVLGLMHWNHIDCNYFIKSVGQLYMAGLNLKCSALYEPVLFPVPVGTPQISPLITWDHSLSWEIPLFKNEMSANQETKFFIDLSTEEFLSGHVIQDKVLFPATGYIVLAWKAFAKIRATTIEHMPILMEDINFKKMTILHHNQKAEFAVSFLKDSGNFEMLEGHEVVCTGTIREAQQHDQETLSNRELKPNIDNYLEHDDFYKLLHLKGYQYQGKFRGVQQIDYGGEWAELTWKDNWICFLDTMLQTYIQLWSSSQTDLVVPVRLDSMVVFPAIFKNSLDSNNIFVNRCNYIDALECPGIQLRGLTPSPSASIIAPLIKPTVRKQRFCAYFDTEESLSKVTTLELFFEIVLNNTEQGEAETFVFTEVTDCCHNVAVNLDSLVYFKFMYYEHRIVRSENCMECGSKIILPNGKRFGSIGDLCLLSPSNLILTNEVSEIQECMNVLHNNSFLILTTASKISFDFCFIAHRFTENTNMYLIRKTNSVTQQTNLVLIDTPDFAWVAVLKETLTSAKPGSRIHLVSRSRSSGIIGLTNCLLKEPEMQYIRCVYIINSPNFKLLLTDEVLKKDLVFNVYASGTWGTYANISVNDLETAKMSDFVYGTINTIGDVSTIGWVESPYKLYQRKFFQVYYSALNFRDIMLATGRIPKSAYAAHLQADDGFLGIEFSGTYKDKRVCGLSYGKCLASTLDHAPPLLWRVPDHWSLPEAATIPVVYTTVLYALLIRGRLKQGESILIHSGSGGVGLAAITMALAMNCKVFTTVGSNHKREFLKTTFPSLPERQILDSKHGTVFKDNILRQTKGKGVDVVLNSLAQEKLKASLKCVSKRGRFLEIGKFDSFNNNSIGLAILLQNVEMHVIFLDDVLAHGSNELIQLQSMMQDYLDQGKIKPLQFTLFRHEKIQEAFRFFSSRKHVGKVIIEVRDTSGAAQIAALPRTYFFSHKTYIIIGGLGGMGLEIVTWMIGRGAKRIIIILRTGATTSYQKYKVKTWETLGAIIILRNTDISKKEDVAKLIMEVISIGPLGGVFNFALVLQDGIFVNQTSKSFEMTSKCKATATLHFDDLTRLHAPNMDYFVVFSSVACMRGNAGQSNYGYANSSMERVCEQRKQDGFAALAIQWGAVANVGSVAEILRNNKMVAGTIGQPISSCISTLDLLLQQTEAVVGSFVLPKEAENSSAQSQSLSLSENVAKILGNLECGLIDLNATLNEHGMDSIMGAQIKHLIQRKNPDFVPVEGFGSLTFKDLQCLD